MEIIETYSKGYLKRSAIHFLREYFTNKGIKNPTLKDLETITEDELFNGWLSIHSIKEILIFKQITKTK